MRKFAQAHTQGITCCKFSRDGFKILTGSYDHTVRVHGLKSGNTLKVFKGIYLSIAPRFFFSFFNIQGHSSYVNDAIWVANGAQIASCSSDGMIIIFAMIIILLLFFESEKNSINSQFATCCFFQNSTTTISSLFDEYDNNSSRSCIVSLNFF